MLFSNVPTTRFYDFIFFLSILPLFTFTKNSKLKKINTFYNENYSGLDVKVITKRQRFHPKLSKMSWSRIRQLNRLDGMPHYSLFEYACNETAYNILYSLDMSQHECALCIHITINVQCTIKVNAHNIFKTVPTLWYNLHSSFSFLVKTIYPIFVIFLVLFCFVHFHPSSHADLRTLRC